ncbi:hypothetical protein MN116_006373, partial [Schistosoma mekongi]
KLKTELKRTEQVMMRRVSLSNQDVTKQIYSCLLCGQPPVSDSQGVDECFEQNWIICHDCQNTVCPNCAVQIGKNSESEIFWLCKLCQKKRQLIVSSNSWLQNLTKTNNEETKEMQTIIQETHAITRTSSYSQYEDLIDQVNLNESIVNNKQNVSYLNDSDNRQEIDNETLNYLTLNDKESMQQHENIYNLKEIQSRKFSEQTNSSNNDNQYVNNENDQKSIKQKSINDSINVDNNNNNNDNSTNLIYHDRLHLYFTQQINKQFSMNDIDADDNVDQDDDLNNNEDLFHIYNDNSNHEDNQFEKKSLSIIQQLHLNEEYTEERLDIIDTKLKKASSVIIDEKLFEMNRKYAKSTFPQIIFDDRKTDITTCTVTSINIPSYVDRQQIINDDYATSSADYMNTPYESINSQQHEQFIEHHGDNIVTSNYDENVNDTLQSFYPSKYTDLESDEDFNHLSFKDLLKLEISNTCNQSYVDRDETFGLIIPQNSYDDVSKSIDKGNTTEANEITMTKLESDYSHMTNNRTRRLSQQLHAYKDDKKFASVLSSLRNNQTRRQSYPMINDNVTLSSRQVDRQRPTLTSQISYCIDEYDDDDDGDLNSYYDDDHHCQRHYHHHQQQQQHLDTVQHHEINSNNLNLFFPYNLNEPWDYAEDLRKIDENMYQRTTNTSKITTTNSDTISTTYNLVNSSKLNDDINNIANSTDTVTSTNSYYSDNTLQSLNEDHQFTYDPSMNDSYFNWLNEMNPTYNVIQQNNLNNTNYNMHKSIDYTLECSTMNSTISQSTTSAYTTNDIETTKQNLLLRRCPNFENISRLSNDQTYANNDDSIQLSEVNSNFFGELIQFPDGVNDDQDDLEVINDTPTKVWGREFRDTLQITNLSSNLTSSNLFNDNKSELEIWSNLFSTSEIVIDTAREISTQLNLLSILEEEDEEENEVGEEDEETNRKDKTQHENNNITTTTNNNSSNIELINSRNDLVATTLNNNEQEILKDNEINKGTIKHETTTTSLPSKQNIVYTEEHGTELQNDESSSIHSKPYILSTENIISQSDDYVKSSENNNELVEQESNSYTSFNNQNYTTYKLNESSHKKISSEYKKLKSNLNQFSYTSLLPIDKQLVQNNSKRGEEKFENNQSDLWNSDIHELCDHMMKPVNIIPSLDNSSTVYIKISNDMGEKSSTDRIFYPYNQLDQQQQQQQQQLQEHHHHHHQQQQLQLTKDSNQTTQKKYSLIKFQEEEGSNNIKVTNHNELKKTNEKLNEILVASSLANNNNELLNYPIIDQSFNVNNSLHELQCFNEYQIDNKENKDININKQNETSIYSIANDITSLKLIKNAYNDISSINVSINDTLYVETTIKQPTFISSLPLSSLSLTKLSCSTNEKTLLKRAQLILSTSINNNEPDPTDTLLALTENNNNSNNNNNNSNTFDQSHEIDSCKSSINHYCLSLSCPQSLSNQLIEDNYNDTISECSDFSLHVPITNSIINENSILNELKSSSSSSLHDFQEYYANRQLWESFHSYWYIHILKRITDETLLTSSSSSLLKQSINQDKFQPEYMTSSSSSSRGSYFTSYRRRPYSSGYNYELNNLIDDMHNVYESPTSLLSSSSSSIIHSSQLYNHKSLHDIYPDRYMKSLDYDDMYRRNNKLSSKSNLRHTYDNRPYRSYSEASSILHNPKDKLNLSSIIRYDNRKKKLGLMHHSSSNRLKYIRSNDVENNLQQRNIKDSNRSLKPLTNRDNDKLKDYMYTTRFNKNYHDYEIGNRLRRGSLRSYTPTYKSCYTPQTKWLNDDNNNNNNNNSYLEVGSYYSLPLNDYHRKRMKPTRPTSTSQRYVPSNIEVSPHRKMQSDKWDKSDTYLSRRIGNLSKSTGHLTHLDDLNRISGCTSMQTLRARLAAAHSEFNLDNHENITDSFQSHGFNTADRSGSLDRRTDLTNDFTTRQLRRQVEQHHRRLLKSLMTDEPFESSWPSSFSNFDLQGYLNSYPYDSEMQPTTLISSTLAPPIFSTASTRLPLNIEQSRTDDTIMDPTNNYMSTINQQMLSMPNILTTPNLNSTTPVVLPNQFTLTSTISDNLINTPVINQPTSINVDEPVSISNNTLMELINNPDVLQALTYNPTLINQINSMCLDLAPADINQVTLAAVAGAIAATAVAGTNMLDNSNNNNYYNIGKDNTNQSISGQGMNSVVQNTIESEQMNNYLPTENICLNITNNDVINNVSTYLNTMNISNNDNNHSRMNTSLITNENNSCVNPINSDSIDVLIEQVRRLLDEQNNYQLINTKTTPINTTVDSIINSSSSSSVHVTPFNNQLQSSSSISQTCQSVLTKCDQLQNPEHIYSSNYQKSIKQTQQQEPIDSINQYNKTPSETIDSWLGLSEDEWNYKNYKDNVKNSNTWRDGTTTWPTFNPTASNKPKSLVQSTKCTYDFPTKRLLLMRESKDRHQRGGGIGMRIVGGHIRSDGNLGAFVEEIYPSGPADQLHGEIKEGDEILEWNSIPLVGKTFEEVQAIISQVSEETELLVRARDYTQGDDDEAEDDGEEIEDDEDDEDEEYDEEYIDDDEEQQDDDVQSLVKTYGSASTRNSGQSGNRPHALCHHHAAQHALMSQSKGPPICPHMRQHYLSMPSSNDRHSMSQVPHNPHKFHQSIIHNSTNDQQIQEENIKDSGIEMNKSTKNWFKSNSPEKSISHSSPSTTQNSRYTKQSATSGIHNINNDRRSSKVGRINGPRGSHSSNNEKNGDNLEYGEIELILTFDDYDQSLTVHVARARNLPAMDLNGLADPFVKVRLHPDPTEDPDFNRQTKYMPNTLTPEWQQTVVFMNCIKRTLKRRVLEVTVWDFDRLKTNDFMGQTIINLGDREFLDGKPHWFSLHELMPVVVPVSKKSVASSKTSSDSSRQAKSSKESNSKRSTVNKPSRDQLQNQRMNT